MLTSKHKLLGQRGIAVSSSVAFMQFDSAVECLVAAVCRPSFKLPAHANAGEEIDKFFPIVEHGPRIRIPNKTTR